MTNNPKHEPVSEDVEREAFEKVMSGPKFGYDMRRTPDSKWYANADTLSAWFGWQARSAAVKPHVDENGEQWTGSLRDASDASTGNTERTGVEKLVRDAYFEGAYDHRVTFEEQERAWQHSDAKVSLRSIPASPSSPLSEEKLAELLSNFLFQSRFDGSDEVPFARGLKIAKALLPHLSDTSADKARVQGLVEVAAAVTGNYSEMTSKNAFEGRVFQSRIRQLREALAAFEKGV